MSTPPTSTPAIRCLDCGCDYDAAMACDMVLSREQWLLIHPEDDGVLCAHCILRRADKLPGQINVMARITFADDFDPGIPCGLEIKYKPHGTIGPWPKE